MQDKISGRSKAGGRDEEEPTVMGAMLRWVVVPLLLLLAFIAYFQLSEHVRENPSDASGRGAYGLALEAAGRKGEAADHMADALVHGNAELWYRELSRIDPTRALRTLRARANRERSDRMWGALGYALEAQGRSSEAREAFRRALAADPDDSEWADALAGLK